MFSCASSSMGFLVFVLHFSISFELAATLCIGDNPCVNDSPEDGNPGKTGVPSKAVFIQRQANVLMQQREGASTQQASVGGYTPMKDAGSPWSDSVPESGWVDGNFHIFSIQVGTDGMSYDEYAEACAEECEGRTSVVQDDTLSQGSNLDFSEPYKCGFFQLDGNNPEWCLGFADNAFDLGCTYPNPGKCTAFNADAGYIVYKIGSTAPTSEWKMSKFGEDCLTTCGGEAGVDALLMETLRDDPYPRDLTKAAFAAAGITCANVKLTGGNAYDPSVDTSKCNEGDDKTCEWCSAPYWADQRYDGKHAAIRCLCPCKAAASPTAYTPKFCNKIGTPNSGAAPQITYQSLGEKVSVKTVPPKCLPGFESDQAFPQTGEISSFSMEVDFKPDCAASGPDVMSILTIGPDAKPYGSIMLITSCDQERQHYAAAGAWWDGWIKSTDSAANAVRMAAINDGGWHTMSMTWDGTTRTIGLDGDCVAEDTPPENVTLDYTTPCFGMVSNDDGRKPYQFAGSIRNFRVWDGVF